MPLRPTLHPAALLCLSAATLSAQQAEKKHPIDVWTEKAMAKTGGVTMNIREVLGKAYEKWDAELNRVYKKLLAELPPLYSEQLKRSQVSWLRWSKEDSEFSDGVVFHKEEGDAGTMALIIADQLGVARVRQPALDLLQYDSIWEADHGKE